MTDDWWRSFFGGLVVEFWKAAMPAEVTRAEADFLWSELRLEPEGRVLDVACGAGRLAVELAGRGCRVTGVDISPEFLEAGRAAALERGLAVDWELADMRDLGWREAFDAAYCAGSSFGFFDDAGNAAVLGSVARALRPGGRFFADFKSAESILPSFRESREMTLGDLHFAGRNLYDPATGTMESVYTITSGDRSETKRAVHRIYTAREILRLLDDAGFEGCETYGSLSKEPFRLGSPNLLVVASKKRERTTLV